MSPYEQGKRHAEDGIRAWPAGQCERRDGNQFDYCRGYRDGTPATIAAAAVKAKWLPTTEWWLRYLKGKQP